MPLNIPMPSGDRSGLFEGLVQGRQAKLQRDQLAQQQQQFAQQQALRESEEARAQQLFPFQVSGLKTTQDYQKALTDYQKEQMAKLAFQRNMIQQAMGQGVMTPQDSVNQGQNIPQLNPNLFPGLGGPMPGQPQVMQQGQQFNQGGNVGVQGELDYSKLTPMQASAMKEWGFDPYLRSPEQTKALEIQKQERINELEVAKQGNIEQKKLAVKALHDYSKAIPEIENNLDKMRKAKTLMDKHKDKANEWWGAPGLAGIFMKPDTIISTRMARYPHKDFGALQTAFGEMAIPMSQQFSNKGLAIGIRSAQEIKPGFTESYESAYGKLNASIDSQERQLKLAKEHAKSLKSALGVQSQSGADSGSTTAYLNGKAYNIPNSMLPEFLAQEGASLDG